MNGIVEKITTKQALTTFISCILMSFLWAEINELLSHQGLRSAWCYHNPFMILMALSLFVVFAKLKFRSKIVNNLAKAAFMSYIIHTKVINLLNWEDYFKLSIFKMLAIIIVVCISLYLISWCVYKIYNMVSKPIIGRLGNKLIPYFEEA